VPGLAGLVISLPVALALVLLRHVTDEATAQAAVTAVMLGLGGSGALIGTGYYLAHPEKIPSEEGDRY
jgi:hypothetical protein